MPDSLSHRTLVRTSYRIDVRDPVHGDDHHRMAQILTHAIRYDRIYSGGRLAKRFSMRSDVAANTGGALLKITAELAFHARFYIRHQLVLAEALRRPRAHSRAVTR